MGEKDIQHKLLEDWNDVFADIVNVLGFQGRKIVAEEALLPGPTASVYKAQDGRNREQLRDITKFDTNLGTVMMLLGLENQTGEDRDMVFRVMRYDGASYKVQENAPEKYPVITLVLYFGLKRWRAPKSIHEAMIKGIPNWNRIIRAVPNYHINLIEVAFLPKKVREQLTSDFRIVADYFHAVRTRTEKAFYKSPEGQRQIRHVEAMMDFLQTFARDSRYADMKETFCNEVRKGESVTMCTLLDYAENKGVERGTRQGLKLGKRQGLELGKQQGLELGKQQGLELGKQQGLELGKQQGLELGKQQGLELGTQRGIERGIQALIEAGLAFGQTYDSTMQMVMAKFSLDEKTAQKEMRLYWKGK